MFLPGPLRNVLRGGRGGHPEVNDSGQPASSPDAAAQKLVSTRVSRGLEEFFSHIHGRSGLTLLDLGGACQQNVSFITDLGQRFYSEDFLKVLDEAFGAEGVAGQANPGQIEYFLQRTLDYPEGHFDGVLIWDVLEYLAPALLTAVVDRLHKIVRPGSHLLAVFHADDKIETVPMYTFRIEEMNALQVIQHGERRRPEPFNNRSLERLFGRFESVKFFLTRERLRELIVKV